MVNLFLAVIPTIYAIYMYNRLRIDYMKDDEFWRSHNMRLIEEMEGCPNFQYHYSQQMASGDTTE